MADLASVDPYLEGRRSGSRCSVPALRGARRAVRTVAAGAAQLRRLLEAKSHLRRSFVESRRLELLVDLRRDAAHPRAIAAFPTTKAVVTNRPRITDADRIDDSIAALRRESYETVGPGTRSTSRA